MWISVNGVARYTVPPRSASAKPDAARQFAELKENRRADERIRRAAPMMD